MKQLQTLLFLVPAAMLLNACTHSNATSHKESDDVIPVKVISLQTQSGDASIPVSGQFTTDDEVYLSFKIGGVIDRIYVKEGDAIRKGQLLATLKLAEIDAQVAQAKLGYEKAQRDFQRTTNLHNDSVATLEQLQNSKTALDLAKQQLEAAQFNRTYSEIHAPKDGYVLKKLANEGQVVSTGNAVFQTNGAHTAMWLLRIGASDKQWAAIHINDKATVEAGDGKTYEGIVLHRSEGVDPASGTFTIDIKISGDKTNGIASGMFGKATIHTSQAATQSNDTWSIPYDALLDGDGSGGYVFITNDDKTACKVKVTIAGIEKDHVIISDGLQNAKELVISGSAYLADKSPIHIIQ